VTRDDVLRAAVTTTTTGAGSQGPARVALNRVQLRSGAALLASTQTAAHAYSIAVADYSAIAQARDAERARWRDAEGFSLTYLPFVARAVVDALRDFTLMNATVGDDALAVHRDVHLSIAVDLNHQGLVVPVVRAADTLRLRGLARAIDDVAARARAKKLLPDDLAGGTFTITNPGASGTWMSFPIINQPQVAILSTDGVAKRVCADTDASESGRDRIDLRPTGNLCLAFDERVIDPPYAAAFVARVAEIVATRDWRIEL
jgi:2-oxoglutarate dehydrogenase E2 component (dihydrolipoamide succinyltransferase)